MRKGFLRILLVLVAASLAVSALQAPFSFTTMAKSVSDVVNSRYIQMTFDQNCVIDQFEFPPEVEAKAIIDAIDRQGAANVEKVYYQLGGWNLRTRDGRTLPISIHLYDFPELMQSLLHTTSKTKQQDFFDYGWSKKIDKGVFFQFGTDGKRTVCELGFKAGGYSCVIGAEFADKTTYSFRGAYKDLGVSAWFDNNKLTVLNLEFTPNSLQASLLPSASSITRVALSLERIDGKLTLKTGGIEWKNKDYGFTAKYTVGNPKEGIPQFVSVSASQAPSFAKGSSGGGQQEIKGVKFFSLVLLPQKRFSIASTLLEYELKGKGNIKIEYGPEKQIQMDERMEFKQKQIVVTYSNNVGALEFLEFSIDPKKFGVTSAGGAVSSNKLKAFFTSKSGKTLVRIKSDYEIPLSLSLEKKGNSFGVNSFDVEISPDGIASEDKRIGKTVASFRKVVGGKLELAEVTTSLSLEVEGKTRVVPIKLAVRSGAFVFDKKTPLQKIVDEVVEELFAAIDTSGLKQEELSLIKSMRESLTGILFQLLETGDIAGGEMANIEGNGKTGASQAEKDAKIISGNAPGLIAIEGAQAPSQSLHTGLCKTVRASLREKEKSGKVAFECFVKEKEWVDEDGRQGGNPHEGEEHYSIVSKTRLEEKEFDQSLSKVILREPKLLVGALNPQQTVIDPTKPVEYGKQEQIGIKQARVLNLGSVCSDVYTRIILTPQKNEKLDTEINSWFEGVGDFV